MRQDSVHDGRDDCFYHDGTRGEDHVKLLISTMKVRMQLQRGDDGVIRLYMTMNDRQIPCVFNYDNCGTLILRDGHPIFRGGLLLYGTLHLLCGTLRLICGTLKAGRFGDLWDMFYETVFALWDIAYLWDNALDLWDIDSRTAD